MNRFINNILKPSSLTNSTETDQLFAEWDLISFDYGLEHFEVEDKANEKGFYNSPPSDAVDPDEFHSNLELLYQNIINNKSGELASSIQNLETTADRALQKINFLSGDESNNLKNQLEQDYEAYKPEITLLNSRVRSSKNELNIFKNEHKLSRDASYPESKNWNYFIVLCLLGIESVINGSLFASGSAQGIFGGWSIAVLISSINVIFGFMVGAVWFKQAWSINMPMKILGIVGFFIWASFTAVFNLAVGHIRSVYEEFGATALINTEEFNPWNDGFLRFIESPIGLENFLSWVLVFVGVFFAIFALYDGLKSDDKYPGYGTMDRKLRDAQNEQHDLIDGLKDISSNISDDYVKKGDKERKELNEESISLRQRHDFVKERVNEFPNYCAYYKDFFTKLIKAYRNFNIEARTDDPPRYFKDEPSFNYKIDNKDAQLEIISKKIDEIHEKNVLEQDRWKIIKPELEQIKREFLEQMRQDDEIS